MGTALGVPVSSEARWRRVTAPAVVAGVVLGASVLLHARDPHEGGSYGFCPWLVLTGSYCPGCGGLRAVNDLTRGDLAAAASSNVLFVSTIPLILYFWVRWFADRWNGVRRVTDSRRAVRWSVAFAAVVVSFWVVRNLGFAAWLAP